MGIGRLGMAVIAVVAAAMCALSFFLAPKGSLTGEMGICLHSPNLWPLDPLVSWIINTGCLALLVSGAWFLNRHYNFIRTTQPVLPAMFLILAASCPWITYHLSASTLVCGVNLMSLSVLFSCYRSRNATQEMFVIGTFYSIGSMCQYAFLPFLLPIVGGAIAMKCFRMRELLAMGMGLLAPYWIALGFGIVSPEDFTIPELSNLFNGFAQTDELFVLMLSVGVAIFFGLMLGLNNAVKLYAGNSRVNSLNFTIDLVGLTAVACVLVDFSNMTAYLASLYFTVAVQVANLCALWQIRREWLVVTVPAIIYTAFFIVMLLT